MNSDLAKYINVFSKFINSSFLNVSNDIIVNNIKKDDLVHFSIALKDLKITNERTRLIIELLMNNKDIYFENTYSLFKGIPLLSLILLINKDAINVDYYEYQKKLLYSINEMNVEISDFRSIEYVNGLTGLLNYYLILKENEKSLYTKKLYNKSCIIIKILVNYVDKVICDSSSLNLGLSHGISGVLLVLAKSYKQGFKTSEILKGIMILQKILLKQYTNYGIRMPSIIGQNIIFSRVSPSWCYSELGILHALTQSFFILGNTTLAIYFKQKLESVILDMSKYKIISPNFCHGYSGILAFSTLYNLNDENIKKYLLLKIRAFFDESCDSYFYDQYYNQANQVCIENSFSFLDGSVSILLALLFSEGYDLTIWKSMLLLDEYYYK